MPPKVPLAGPNFKATTLTNQFDPSPNKFLGSGYSHTFWIEILLSSVVLPQLSFLVLFANTVLVLEILDFYALLHSHLSIHLQFCVQKIKSYDNLRCLQCLNTPAIPFFSLSCSSCSFKETFLLWFFISTASGALVVGGVRDRWIPSIHPIRR